MAQPIDPTKIAQLLSKSKQKGDYEAEIRELISSGHPGVEVSLTSEGRFKGRVIEDAPDDEAARTEWTENNEKAARNVVVGLNNARMRTLDDGVTPKIPGGNLVRVVYQSPKDSDDGLPHVYMINTQLAGGSADESEDEVTGEEQVAQPVPA